uniref:Uncharacterized protein n=1 Tax=Schizaphis graminum TaxID=13262 RepID=A0A2S2NVP8_SCHGA
MARRYNNVVVVGPPPSLSFFDVVALRLLTKKLAEENCGTRVITSSETVEIISFHFYSKIPMEKQYSNDYEFERCVTMCDAKENVKKLCAIDGKPQKCVCFCYQEKYSKYFRIFNLKLLAA